MRTGIELSIASGNQSCLNQRRVGLRKPNPVEGLKPHLLRDGHPAHLSLLLKQTLNFDEFQLKLDIVLLQTHQTLKECARENSTLRISFPCKGTSILSFILHKGFPFEF